MKLRLLVEVRYLEVIIPITISVVYRFTISVSSIISIKQKNTKRKNQAVIAVLTVLSHPIFFKSFLMKRTGLYILQKAPSTFQ